MLLFFHPFELAGDSEYYKKLERRNANYYNNDSILVLSEQFQSGDFHGTRKNFYETGEMYIITQWENGVKNGKFVQYFINGEINIKANYLRGIYDGEYTSYNTDGTLFFTGFYKRGIRKGEWKYYSNGILDKITHE